MEHAKYNSEQPDVAASAPLPPARKAKRSPSGGLTAISHTVRNFFAEEFQARETRITKIAALAGAEAGWEVEAETLVPDLAIRTLGLPLTQEVLERRRYLVQLDPSHEITGYEPLDEDG